MSKQAGPNRGHEAWPVNGCAQVSTACIYMPCLGLPPGHDMPAQAQSRYKISLTIYIRHPIIGRHPSPNSLSRPFPSPSRMRSSPVRSPPVCSSPVHSSPIRRCGAPHSIRHHGPTPFPTRGRRPVLQPLGIPEYPTSDGYTLSSGRRQPLPSH